MQRLVFATLANSGINPINLTSTSFCQSQKDTVMSWDNTGLCNSWMAHEELGLLPKRRHRRRNNTDCPCTTSYGYIHHFYSESWYVVGFS